MSTYSQFQEQVASEKIGLVILEAAERITGWTLYSGSIYQTTVTEKFITRVTVDGTAVTQSATLAAIASEGWYHDRANDVLYLWTTTPVDNYVVATHRLFFSSAPVNLSNDLTADGAEVYWLPLLKETSEFTVEIDDSKTNLGLAISGKASLKFINDRSYWGPIYDKKVFENKRVYIYSWSRGLPATEAKLIYTGFVQTKKYSIGSIVFELRDLLDGLRTPVSLSNMESVAGARIPDSLAIAKQRRIYGYVNGHVPTPIDQVLSGYPLTGTVAATNASATVTGTSTTFLKELSPGDEILIDGEGVSYNIESVDSNTQVTLSEVYAQDSVSGADALVKPSHAKRYINREFLLAGHALARPETEITSVIDNSIFYVDDTSKFFEGDQIEVNGGAGIIRVLGTTIIKLEQALPGSVDVGDTVYRSTVMGVYINNRLLTYGDDYTYDETAATLTLNELAEFNVAPIQTLTGTVDFTSASRAITGTGTLFMSELSTGDWIRDDSEDDWFEVLSITDDVTLTLRSNCTYTAAGAGGQRKKPEVYDSASDTLSCDVIGKADSDGNLLAFAGGIIQDLLVEAGRTDDIVESTFETADELVPYRLGICIPPAFADKGAPDIRTIVGDICRSVFASVIQNEDFQLELISLDPSSLAVETATRLGGTDVLDLSVRSDSSFILKSATVRYGNKEHDRESEGSASYSKTESNQRGQYAAESNKTFEIKTYLVDEDDAQLMASRWAFLFDSANTEIVIRTKMKTARLHVMEIINLDLPYLYTRLGSSSSSKLASITKVRKSLSGMELHLTDFGNALTRVARIAADDSSDYSDSTDDERLVNGYIPDTDGMVDGDGNTDGINFVW